MQQEDVTAPANAAAPDPDARPPDPGDSEIATRANEEWEAILLEAFYYAYPLVAMGRQRLAMLGTDSSPGRNGLQRWYHRSELSRPEVRGVTTPNADTLYSSLWLDLSQGPFLLSVPDTNGRYYSLAFLDMATNNFAMVGRRTTGTRAASFVIAGPDSRDELPRNVRVIRAPCNDVLVASRILVNGEEDLAAVAELQSQYGIEALGAEQVPPLWQHAPPAGHGPEAFVQMANLVLARNPPPRHETRMLERFAAVGIGGAGCRWDALPAEVRLLWARQWPSLLALLEAGLSSGTPDANGWHYNRDSLGNFGTDYVYRAQVAHGALLALEPVEAIYPSVAVDSTARPLSGRHGYRLTLCPEHLPVNAFWSLTLYQVEPDGKLYFHANPIRRYTIGDRTPGLAIGTRGDIDIWIQHDAPAIGARMSNWLPAPAGEFRLVLRAYEPSAAFRDGQVRLPAVERWE